MENLLPNDILTRVTRYNLIREQRLVYIDVHERLQGQLAGRFVAVPNRPASCPCRRSCTSM